MGKSRCTLDGLSHADGNGQLDLCDPQRLFENQVPSEAAKCEVLLCAVLAFAARHKANTTPSKPTGTPGSGGDDPPVLNYADLAIGYQIDCIYLLIDILRTVAEGYRDEKIFAAVIILRVVEEMEGTRCTPEPFPEIPAH